jgi:hypothetical protein
MKLEFDNNDLLLDVLDAVFVAQLKNQLKNSREDLAAAVIDQDKDTNQGVINACLVLLAYCTTQSEFNDLIDDINLIPLGD